MYDVERYVVNRRRKRSCSHGQHKILRIFFRNKLWHRKMRLINFRFRGLKNLGFSHRLKVCGRIENAVAMTATDPTV